MVNWNVLVKSKNNAKAAREALAKEIYPENPNCLDSTDLDFVGEQDYITAVPVEISLIVGERRALRKGSPDTRWVITGVKEADVTNLVVNYGYKVIEPEVPVPEKVEDSSYFEVNGKAVTREEYEEAVKEFREEFNKALERLDSLFN